MASKNEHVSVSAKKGGHKGGKIRHVVLKPAENGFTSEIHRDPAEGSKPMEMYSMEPETNVHPTLDHLVDHVRSSFGGKKGKKEDLKHEAGESKKYEADEHAGKGAAGEEEEEEDEEG